MNHSINSAIINLNNIPSRELAGDGDEGPAGELRHGDLLPCPRHHGVGTTIQSCREDEPLRHVTQQGGFQNCGVRQECLETFHEDH